MAEVIASQVNLPDPRQQPFSPDSLVELSLLEAAHVFAVAGTTSLVHGTASPRKSFVEDAKRALRDLEANAKFLSNGKWECAPSRNWHPLSSATFECGLIGFDQGKAFIFWVEQED